MSYPKEVYFLVHFKIFARRVVQQNIAFVLPAVRQFLVYFQIFEKIISTFNLFHAIPPFLQIDMIISSFFVLKMKKGEG